MKKKEQILASLFCVEFLSRKIYIKFIVVTEEKCIFFSLYNVIEPINQFDFIY